MSPCNIRFSPLAKQDLDGIHGYISNSLGSPIAGNNTVERILDSIENLRRYPDSGTPLSSRYQITSEPCSSSDEANPPLGMIVLYDILF